MVVCDGGFMVIGFDSLWVVDGLSYNGFVGSWDLSKSVGIRVGFPWKGLWSWRQAWQWVFHGRVAERERKVWLREENK